MLVAGCALLMRLRERREREGESEEQALRLPYGISQGLIATCLRRGTDILRAHVLIARAGM